MVQSIKSKLKVFIPIAVILLAVYIFVSYNVAKRKEQLDLPLHPTSNASVESHISMARWLNYERGQKAALEYLDYAYEVTNGNEAIRLAMKEITYQHETVTIKGEEHSFSEKDLFYSNTQLSHNDIISISRLFSLESLYIRNAELSDISALGSLEQLTRLDLSGNEIKDVSVLKNLTSLETLNLDNNPISDISPLLELDNLTIVTLYGCNVSIEDKAALETKLEENKQQTRG